MGGFAGLWICLILARCFVNLLAYYRCCLPTFPLCLLEFVRFAPCLHYLFDLLPASWPRRNRL